MHKTLFISICSIAIIFTGCSKDDDDENPSNENSSYQVDYKNQNLQGKIGGENWLYVVGNAHTSHNSSKDYDHWFMMADTTENDSCSQFSNKRRLVGFFLNDSNSIMEVGKYPLDFSERTVTLSYFENNTFENIVCSKGEYELLSVDTTNKIVTGRMDAYSDADNYVNGNFTIKYCYW